MITDYDDDTHFCLKCHSTILGLDNYVTHRKSGCTKNIVDPSKSPLPSQLLPADEIGLKADDFFSSLELRSSSKKPIQQSTSGKSFSGILTRSKTTAVIQATISQRESQEPQQSKSGKNVWIGGNQLKDLGTGDNQSKLIKAVANLERRKEEPPRIGGVYEDSDEDSEEYDYDDDETSEEDDVPPRNYTGGKWKPSSPIQWGRENREWNIPPPSFTGGKWKPNPSKRLSSPPPSYTRGKWKPSEVKDGDDDPTPSGGGKYPPPSHTRGKWKPRNENEEDFPPPSHTRGKWKPKVDHEEEVPSPSHTKGKWKPKSDNDNIPPPTYTKGKWKPKSEHNDNIPPSSHTKGKWKPKSESQDNEILTTSLSSKGKGKTKPDNINKSSTEKHKPKKHSFVQPHNPPPDHTKGKWKPKPSDESYPTALPSTSKKPDSLKLLKHIKTRLSPTPSKQIPCTSKKSPDDDLPDTNWISPQQIKNYKITDDSPFRKSSGTIQYWCSTCNRRLASKLVYERHLKSELHSRRTRPEGEFDDGALIKREMKTEERPAFVVKTEVAVENEPNRKRKRKKIFEVCTVCQSKVTKHLMGKHLISHYHCRKGDIGSAVAKNLVLENIYSIVLESPFQCCVCKFYCNTHEDFLMHWKSEFHKTKDNDFPGYFLCAFCKYRADDSETMLLHLNSSEHLEVVSVINRSVPITIKKINQIGCLSCTQKFTLNIQLLKHCRQYNHDNSNANAFKTEHYECKDCNKTFLTAISVQRHRRKVHKHEYFFCSFCNLKFNDASEAREHRKSTTHKYTLLEQRKPKNVSLRRKCEYCEEYFANFLLLKEHLKNQHPEHKIRCPYCGTNFTVTQELANHIRTDSCKFPDTSDHSDNAYRCEKCLFTSNSTSELLFHVALHNEPIIMYPTEPEDGTRKFKVVPKYKCPVCEKIFPKSSLQAHLRLHTQERPYVCKICNASFARKNNLLFHVKNHDKKNRIKLKKKSGDEKPFLCSTCGADFSKKFTLQQHMLTHGGKLCKCPEIGCFYTARKMSEIKEHFRIHCDARDFCCNVCDYKGKTKSQLKRHLSTHEDIKKHHCNLCAFTARTAAHLKRHVRLHTGAKPYSCPHCNYKCNTLENLRKHVLSTTKHPGKSLYECKFCPKDSPFQTNFAKDFKNHLSLDHNEVFANSKEAATYVAGIYEADEDSTYLIDVVDSLEAGPSDRTSESHIVKTDPSESILKLKTNEDPVVAQLIPTTKDSALDQMLPMFIIPKDDSRNVEITPDSWNLIGRYDVEESGTLVPFQSGEDEELFQEHF